MFRTVNITSSNANNEELRKLYESALPEGERIPFDTLIPLLEPMNFVFTAYFEGETFVSITLFKRLPKYNIGAYFAVPESLRNKGRGQKIITQILSTYSEDNPFVLFVELPLKPDAPNMEICKRRHAFYQRNGFKDTGFYYSDSSSDYTIMYNGKDSITKKDSDEIIASIKPLLDLTLEKDKKI